MRLLIIFLLILEISSCTANGNDRRKKEKGKGQKKKKGDKPFTSVETFYQPHIGHDYEVRLNFSVNPVPTALEWSYGSNFQDIIQIPSDNGKFATSWINYPDNNYQATLKITGMTQNDIETKFRLHVTNGIGETYYGVMFSVVCKDQNVKKCSEMKLQCRKSCGKCDDGDCTDKRPNCQRHLSRCPKTCNLCDGEKVLQKDGEMVLLQHIIERLKCSNEGGRLFGSMCLFFSTVDDGGESWIDAMTICRDKGMQLSSRTELEVIGKELLKNRYVRKGYWLGGSKDGVSFMWPKGREMVLSDLLDITAADDKKCIVVNSGSTITYASENCDTKQHYICSRGEYCIREGDNVNAINCIVFSTDQNTFEGASKNCSSMGMILATHTDLDDIHDHLLTFCGGEKHADSGRIIHPIGGGRCHTIIKTSKPSITYTLEQLTTFGNGYESAYFKIRCCPEDCEERLSGNLGKQPARTVRTSTLEIWFEPASLGANVQKKGGFTFSWTTDDVTSPGSETINIITNQDNKRYWLAGARGVHGTWNWLGRRPKFIGPIELDHFITSAVDNKTCLRIEGGSSFGYAFENCDTKQHYICSKDIGGIY